MEMVCKLQVPGVVWFNQMPVVDDGGPQPRLVTEVQASVLLTNEGAQAETVTAPTPCDVIYWQIELNRAIIEREPPEICIQQYQMREIAPGQTVFDAFRLALNPWLYSDGEQYSVKCRFWGHPAEAQFTARVAV